MKSWPEGDSNLRSREYRAHALITELSGQTMTYAEWSTGSSNNEAQIIAG